MIKGFEEFTVHVSEDELWIVEAISKSLAKRIGKENKITNAQMRESIQGWNGTKITDSKMRRYIQYIRANQLVLYLCASKGGYYIARDEEEWNNYRQSYRLRIQSMQFTMACMDLNSSVKRVTNN